MLLIYCTVSLIIIHYLWVSEIVHSQVSPFLLSISAPPSVAVFVAPASSHRRNLAEIAMDNESTEQKTNSFGNLDVLILTSKISRENMLR